MNSRYCRGWFGESQRHYLASKGISTKRYFASIRSKRAMPAHDQEKRKGWEEGVNELYWEMSAARKDAKKDLTKGEDVSKMELGGSWRTNTPLRSFPYDPSTRMEGGMEINKDLFDETKTLVHGTTRERAEKILRDRKLKAGTWPEGKGGGIDDAVRYVGPGDEHVLVIAEADMEPFNPRGFTQWHTLVPERGQGFPKSVENRGFEREGRDKIEGELPLKKMRVVKIDRDHALRFKYDKFEEIPELRYDE